MLRRHRFPLFLLAALLAHALLMFLGSEWRARSPRASSAEENAATTIEIAVADEPPASAPSTPTTSPAHEAASDDQHPSHPSVHVIAPAQNGNGPETSGTEAGGDTIASGAPVGAVDGGTWTFAPTVPGSSPMALGIDKSFALRIAAETPGRPQHDSTGGVAEALGESNAALGTGAGAVLRAAESAAKHSTVANFSSATWEVEADVAGNVTRVRVTDATSDLPVWEFIVEDALRGVLVTSPKGPHGVVLRFRIDVEERFPDGSRAASGTGKPSALGSVVNALNGAVGAITDPDSVGAHPMRMTFSKLLSVLPK